LYFSVQRGLYGKIVFYGDCPIPGVVIVHRINLHPIGYHTVIRHKDYASYRCGCVIRRIGCLFSHLIHGSKKGFKMSAVCQDDETQICEALRLALTDEQIGIISRRIQNMRAECVPLQEAVTIVDILNSELEKRGDDGLDAIDALDWLIRYLYAANGVIQYRR
jgi:hypothetical protein